MEKYKRYLPIIIYPYIYMIVMVVDLFISKLFDTYDYSETVAKIYMLIALLSTGFGLIWSIYIFIDFSRGRLSPLETSKIVLIIKLVQIPAYVINFGLGLLGAFLGIVLCPVIIMTMLGFGIVVLMIVIDVITIFFTGLVAAGNVKNMKKVGLISKRKAFWHTIGNFIFCIDVLVAFAAFIKCKVGKH